jgi:TRAP-type C4-dicarboxylate transport system substrate-binding protein
MRLLGLLAVALLLAGCGRQLPPDTTELLFASPYGAGHPFSRADRTWMKFVEERSDGRIRFRTNWSGGLLSSDESMTELRHGVADIGLITPIYVKGGAHLLRIQTGFYTGARTIEDQVALYRCMEAAEPQFARELSGLRVLAVQGGVLPGIITRDRAIRSLDDLKGLRLRAPTELLTVLRALGADPVNMPMGDVYSALAKGVIDGVVAPPDTFQSLHFAEVARYFVAIDIPRGAYPARAISEKRWQALSQADRDVLTEGVRVWEAALADENRKAVTVGHRVAVDAGVTFTTISAADQARFDVVYNQGAASSVGYLRRYGIDGRLSFQIARSSIGPQGVRCSKGSS